MKLFEDLNQIYDNNQIIRLVKAYALIIIEYLHVPSEMATNSEELHIKCGQLVEKFLSKCELKSRK